MFVTTLLNFALAYEKPAEKVKRKLFSSLQDMLSGDKKLKNEGRIRILEIGIGTGTNFKYYPKGCQLIPLDSNEEVKTKLIENCKNYPHIELKNLIVAEAENMEEIEDNSVDAVVCSLVLCSAKDPKRILREIKRVLLPGGKLFFLEHVHAENGTFKNKLQSALTVTNIWPASALGCELNRHTGETILKAGFSEVDIKKTDIVIEKPYMLRLMNPHIYGIATK
ncbi:hypothetical protein J437_LFUL006160 [Ladona fulva]|uniref:Methyltransferase type 11 domain-containing protein n=1 Tax=Ladona fulva TaxID=123851 RepID=A0A8K0JYS3_LADFU|nr:hypothetical protein J437_LFUL006160 [Ladona fulva]